MTHHLLWNSVIGNKYRPATGRYLLKSQQREVERTALAACLACFLDQPKRSCPFFIVSDFSHIISDIVHRQGISSNVPYMVLTYGDSALAFLADDLRAVNKVFVCGSERVLQYGTFGSISGRRS